MPLILEAVRARQGSVADYITHFSGSDRAVAEFSYDVLAERLGRSLGALPS